MGFFENIQKGFKNYLAKEIRAFNVGELTPNEDLPAVAWLYQSEYGVPMKADILTLRALAKSSFPKS